jgi:hypothetical protein
VKTQGEKLPWHLYNPQPNKREKETPWQFIEGVHMVKGKAKKKNS